MQEETIHEKLIRIEECIQSGEDAYEQFYEPSTHSNPAGHYSDAKDMFGEAIALAHELGRNEQARALTQRLDHIKAVFRSQFSGFDSSLQPSPPMPDESTGSDDTAASVEEGVQHIRANAALVMSTLSAAAGFEFNYASTSVKWLDGYIEQIRTDPLIMAGRDQLVSNFGSYLGEAIVAIYGGVWGRDESGWHIYFHGGNRAYPFNKVSKQFLNGSVDSIYAFYDSIEFLLLGKEG